MKKVKITVIRKDFHPDLAEEYLSDGAKVGACPLLNAGDTFLCKDAGRILPMGLDRYLWKRKCSLAGRYIYAVEPQGRPDDRLLYRWNPACDVLR